MRHVAPALGLLGLLVFLPFATLAADAPAQAEQPGHDAHDAHAGHAHAEAATPPAAGDGLAIPIFVVDAKGASAPIGTITASDTKYGLLLTPALRGLPPGVHGFHVHEHPSCEAGEKDGNPVAALAAGGHYDPARSGRHEGPYGEGHLGDLPALYVNPNGTADYPVLAPRLKVADLAGRSVMVHAGGDNHADHPAPLGGGGARIACGVVPALP